MMRHYFLDTNVVLDFLARREPFAQDALALFRAGLERRATLYVASLSFGTIYYVLSKQSGSTTARGLVSQLAQVVTIVGVDGDVVRQAITGPFPDFEDGMQYYAAAVAGVAGIVTRDHAGFIGSTLPVLTPAGALAELSRSSHS